MRIAIDTNRYTDYIRQSPEAVGMVDSASAVYVPVAVLAELHAGFRRGSRRAANETLLEQFLARPDVHVLNADSKTASVFADLWCDLLAQGTPIPTNDVWIAALVVQHGLTLYTRDRHFDRLPQVPRI